MALLVFRLGLNPGRRVDSVGISESESESESNIGFGVVKLDSGKSSSDNSSSSLSVNGKGSQLFHLARTYPFFSLATLMAFVRYLPSESLLSMTVVGVFNFTTIKGPWKFFCNFFLVLLILIRG